VVPERTGTPQRSQVKLSGIVPPLADPFHQRPETGLDLRAGLYPGDTVVLTHGEESAAAPATQGGTGKTQLAVAFRHALWDSGAVEALVWVSATSREAIITSTLGAAEGQSAQTHQSALWKPEAHPLLFRKGAEPGRQRAGRIGDYLRAGHAHHQHPATWQRARRRGDVQG
jgi:hypothetical protein